MSVLTTKEIRRRLLLKLSDPSSLVITPPPRKEAFDRESVDLRLGRNFLLPRTMHQPYFSPDRNSRAILHTEVFVPFGKYLVVPAHQTVLGATLEYIKLPGDVSGEILTKSSVARTFIVVETAPWVHPEYRGCLTLEIANVSNTPVLLYPGRLIGQLILMEVGPRRRPSGASKRRVRQREKLESTYFGPVYPEAAFFNDPEEDLHCLGVKDVSKIVTQDFPTRPPD